MLSVLYSQYYAYCCSDTQSRKIPSSASEEFITILTRHFNFTTWMLLFCSFIKSPIWWSKWKLSCLVLPLSHHVVPFTNKCIYINAIYRLLKWLWTWPYQLAIHPWWTYIDVLSIGSLVLNGASDGAGSGALLGRRLAGWWGYALGRALFTVGRPVLDRTASPAGKQNAKTLNSLVQNQIW